MTETQKRWSISRILIGAGLGLAGSALVLWPQTAMQAVRDGLGLCGNILIPSLFPFFVLSALVVDSGGSQWLGRLFQPIMTPLFRVNGAGSAALALGLLGGYPVGARTAVRLYQNGQCSRAETERLLAFCNNSGPAFVLGIAGVGILGSSLAGLTLYLIHILAAVGVGLVFRFYRPNANHSITATPAISFQTVQFSSAFSRAITGAMQAVLNICAFVLFFTVLLRLLDQSRVLDAVASVLSGLLSPFGLDFIGARATIAGFLELTSGMTTLVDCTQPLQFILAAGFLGWGGLSVHGQVLSILEESGLSPRTYLMGKFLHGLLSALLAAILLLWLPTFSASPAWSGGSFPSPTFGNSPAIWLVGSLLLLAILLYVKKKWKLHRSCAIIKQTRIRPGQRTQVRRNTSCLCSKKRSNPTASTAPTAAPWETMR